MRVVRFDGDEVWAVRGDEGVPLWCACHRGRRCSRDCAAMQCEEARHGAPAHLECGMMRYGAWIGELAEGGR